jgi:hypothetical protein
MGPDENEPASSGQSLNPDLPGTTSVDLSAPRPGGCAPGSGGQRQALGRAPNVVTAIAAAIINSSMITHSIVITMIVTISVLTTALAWSDRVRGHADR